jgi:hypothetical protein
MKVAKVIATCFKPKEVIEKTSLSGNPLGYYAHSQNFTSVNDIIKLLELNINVENNSNPGAKRDLIIVNADVNCTEGNKYINSISGAKISDGKVICFTRKNIGLSFGSYNDAFIKFRENYDYFLFTEDDWLIFKDNYLKIGIDILNKTYLCGMVSYVGVTRIHKSHWKPLNLNKRNAYGSHGGIGLVSTKILNEVVHKNGSLPYYKGNDYRMGIRYGELAFPNSIVKLGYKIVDLPRDNILGMPAYDYMRNIKYKKFPNLLELVNHYFQIFVIKSVKKKIWSLVSKRKFTREKYLNLLKIMKKIKF